MSGEYQAAVEAEEQEEAEGVQPLVSVAPPPVPEPAGERKMSVAVPSGVAAEISKVAKELRVPGASLKLKVAEVAFAGIDRATILDLADQVYQENRQKLG